MTDDWQRSSHQDVPAEAPRSFPSYITWRVSHLIIGVMAVVMLVFLISSIILPVESKYGEDSPEVFFASAVSSIAWDIGFVLVVIALVRHTGGSLVSLGLRQASFFANTTIGRMNYSRFTKVALLVLAGYGMAYFTVMLYGILVTVTGADFLEPSEQLPDTIFDSTLVTVMTGLAVVIGAPIAEEILFRGFIFGGMRRYMSFWPAALLSGVIFSSAHFNLGLVIPFTLVGAALAWSYERSNSIYTSMLVHFLFNLTSFSILVFLPEAR